MRSLLLVIVLALTLGACRARVRMVSDPPEVTIILIQRPEAHRGCAMTDPEVRTVLAGQPFAFENRTGLKITLMQNEANIFFATLMPGQTSSSMVLASPQNYHYAAFAQGTPPDPDHPCRLSTIQVVDR